MSGPEHPQSPRDARVPAPAAPSGGREPSTLIREGGSPALYLEAANRAFEPSTTEEARAWAALESRRRLPTGVRLGWFALVAAAGAVAAVVGLPWLAARVRGDASGVPTVALPVAAPGVPAAGVPPHGPQIQPLPPSAVVVGPGGADDLAGPNLGPAPSDVTPAPLRPGRATFAAAGVKARLSARGVARMFHGTVASAPRIALERGRLDIDGSQASSSSSSSGGAPAAVTAPVAVAPGAPARAPQPAPPPQRVAVSAAAYVFQGEGSRYSVSLDRGKVDLEVKGGRVLVWSSQRLVARVLAGERWSSAGRVQASAAMEAVGPAEAPAAAEPPAAPAGGDCLQLARAGKPDAAVTCFEAQAARPGLTGELALVEIARIRRDVQGDLAGAERALAEHRRRFPSGALAAEAATSRVELLLRLGRAADALAEAAHLGGGEAAYFRGLALAKLGRRDEARRALDEYLGRPDAPHRAEATKRRDELGP